MSEDNNNILHAVYRKRADASRARGHAALRPSMWFGGVLATVFGYHLRRQSGGGGGGGADYDAAAEHFQAASGGYKMINDWAAAAECLQLYAAALTHLGQPGLAAGELVDAAHCCVRTGNDAAPFLRLAADTYLSANRFDRAAKCVLEMAAAADATGSEEARQLYAEAVDLFGKTAAGGDSTDCRHCRVKLGELASSDAEAADIFERLGRDECVGDNRRRHGGASYLARKFFLQSLLCHLAQGDTVQARRKQEQFADLDCTFPGSRENAFVAQLITAMDDGSAEVFADACADYDRVTPLDAWKTSVLLRAKSHLMVLVEEEEEQPDLR
jgi:alpha-soluble NSF attachment protein